MIKLTAENTAKAIQRCKQVKPKVQYIQDRTFIVSSSSKDNFYQVQFNVINGERFGQCQCKASEKGMVCFHLVAGAAVNIYRQGLKRQTA